MADNIIEYFNQNPLVGFFLIVLLLILFYFLFTYNRTTCENMVGSLPPSGTCSQALDQKFYAQFVGPSKLVNFKCRFKGKEYYLANMKKSRCQNKLNDPNNPDNIDCSDSVMVLVEPSILDPQLQQYLSEISIDTKTCNYKRSLECYSKNGSSEDCDREYKSCENTRMFNHDYNVSEVTQINSGQVTRKYVVTGTATPMKSDQSDPTIFNSYLYNQFGYRMMCGDMYPYGQNPNNNNDAEVMVIESVPTSNGGIIGGPQDTLKVRLKMESNDVVVGKNPSGFRTVTPLIDETTGKVQMKSTYIGACENITCVVDDISFIRICLYDDILNPNVLEFTPILVT